MSETQQKARVYPVPPARTTSAWRVPEPIGPRTVVRWLLVFAAIALVVWILRRAGASITPFIIGLGFAYLLFPLVKRLDRYMPRWASILVTYLVGLGILALGFTYIVPPAVNQIGQFIRNVPEYVQSAETDFRTRLNDFQDRVSPEVQEQIDEQIVSVQETIRNNATEYAQQVGAFLFASVITLFQTLAFIIGFLVIPFFLFYLLIDVDRLPNTVNRTLHPRIRADFWNLWRIFDNVLGSYIRGQLILAAIIGGAVFIGLTALNLIFGFEIPYVILLSIVAAFGELIPVIGPVLSAIPAVLLALQQGPTAALVVVVLFVIIQQLENQVLVPRIVGNTLRLHPALLMALLVIAAGVGGLFLVIISAPLTAMLRDLFIYAHRRLREPPLLPHEAIDGLVADEELDASDRAGVRVSEQPTHTAG